MLVGKIPNYISGNTRASRVEDYLEEGGPPNAQLAADLLIYGKIILDTTYALRTILLLVSFCKHKATKSFLALFVIERAAWFLFLPIPDERILSSTWLTLGVAAFFGAFRLWEVLIGAVAVFTSFKLSRYLYFDESINVASLIFLSLLFGLLGAMIHGLMNKLCFFYIDVEVLREGNE